MRRSAAAWNAPAATATTTATVSIGAWRRARWVLLAFIPSSLMLAVTSYLTTDIAAVPLLWTVPLGLYLLTFVLAFGSSGERMRAVALRAWRLVIVPLALLMVGQIRGPLLIVMCCTWSASRSRRCCVTASLPTTGRTPAT